MSDSTGQASAGISADSLASSAAASSGGSGSQTDVVTELFKLVGQVMGVFSPNSESMPTHSSAAADSFVSSVAGVPSASGSSSMEAESQSRQEEGVSLSPLAAGGQVSSQVSVSVSGPEL